MKRVRNKLVLKVEVVRDLSARELDGVVGGWTVPMTTTISKSPTCPPPPTISDCLGCTTQIYTARTC